MTRKKAALVCFFLIFIGVLLSCAPVPSPDLRAGASLTAPTVRDGCGGSRALSGRMKSFKKYGLSLRTYTCLAGKLTARIEPAVSATEAAGFDQAIVPEHLVISFDAGYASQQMLYRQAADMEAGPQIVIYPTAAYAAMNNIARQEIDNLQRLLDDRSPATLDSAPFLPTVNASRMLVARPVTVDFANGSGIRYLTQLAQESRPVNNQEIFYTFQGLTADGAYYVAAFFPVRTSYLPDSAAQVSSSVDGPEYGPTIAETTRALNDLLPADFSPHLFLLDALIASMEVDPQEALPRKAPAAETATPAAIKQVSPLAGIVYATADGLWKTDDSGEARQLLNVSGYTALQPAPDLQHAAFVDGDGRLWLADLTQGGLRQPALEATVARLHGWANAQTLLLGVWLDEEESWGDSTGHLAQLDIKRGTLDLLDAEHVSLGTPAMIPGGRVIAYDVSPYYQDVENGARFYIPGRGSQPFDTTIFSATPDQPPWHLSNPAWSPDGRSIVWRWQAEDGLNSLVLFDLLRREALTLHSWQPRGFGALPPSPVWSADGSWLAVEIWAGPMEETGLWLMSADGNDARLLAGGSNPHWLGGQRLVYASCDVDQICHNRIYDLRTDESAPLDLPTGTILQVPQEEEVRQCSEWDRAWALHERNAASGACRFAAEVECAHWANLLQECWSDFFAPPAARRR